MKIEAKEEQSERNPSRIFWQFCDTGKKLDFHHVRVRIGICLFLGLLKRTLRAFQRAKDRPNRSSFAPPIRAPKMTSRVVQCSGFMRIAGRPASLDLGRLGRRERDQTRLLLDFNSKSIPRLSKMIPTRFLTLMGVE